MDTHSSPRKHREIRFCRLHPLSRQAQAAAAYVSEMQGVHESAAINDHQLQVGYDVVCITLQHIEDTLTSEGYHLDNSLISKLKRALYYYTEETERANLGIAPTGASTQVFVNRYQRLSHGCRDERPEHWRNYL